MQTCKLHSRSIQTAVILRCTLAVSKMAHNTKPHSDAKQQLMQKLAKGDSPTLRWLSSVKLAPARHRAGPKKAVHCASFLT